MVDRVQALFGIETEYAVSVVGNGAVPQERAVRRIYERATARPHLPGIESGVFLPNGGRFYIDGGYHPEYASPETTNPWDAVRYAIAGDRHMWQLAHEVASSVPEIPGLVVRKGNVDYLSHTTWASHENYLHRCAPAIVRPGLIAHLVSRIVFTGSGGFDPLATESPAFVLSPRALFIRRTIAASASGSPALVDDRNQPHCRDFHRQHVMCGDATQSELTTFLRIGTTALVVALIDAGRGVEWLELANPIRAVATVARDLTLRAQLALVSGSSMTAIEIQRRYLQQARAHLTRLPEWAEGVCEVWEDTLQRLERGQEAVADRLDWAIKHAMFTRHMVRRGPNAAGLHQELCEIDLRFAQVYPASLFQSLDDAGVLRHHVSGIAKIDEAVSSPPSDGRARIRGAVVKRLAGEPGVQCGWDVIRDSRTHRTLDLGSPFVTDEEWKAPPPLGTSPRCALVSQLVDLASRPSLPISTRLIREAAQRIQRDRTVPPPRSGEHAIELNNLAIAMRQDGRLEDAEWLLRAALAIDISLGTLTARKIPHRRNNLASVLLMQGRVFEAREQVTLAWWESGTAYDRTSVRILVVRLAIAFVSDEPADVLIGQLKRHLTIQPLPDYAHVESHWRVAPLLASLCPRLATEEHMLLAGVASVLNGERLVESLLAIPLWARAREQPLDTAWPEL